MPTCTGGAVQASRLSDENTSELVREVIILTESTETQITDIAATASIRKETGEEDTSSGLKNLSNVEIANLKVKYPELEIRPKRRATPKQRVIIWITGAVIAALLPLAAIAVSAHPFGFYEVTAKGDLLVISAVLMIAGLAELVLLFWRMPDGKELHIALIPLGIVLYLAGDAFWYGLVSSQTPKLGEPAGTATLAYGSTAMFAVAAIITSYCVWLSGSGE